VERVIVVGGGPAGAVAALVLARRGVPVTVLEACPGPALKVGETLPSNLAPLLRRLGLEGLLADPGSHLRSQGNRSFWGSAMPVESPFLATPHGEGWHVDRRRFEAGLAQAAIAAGVDWRWGVRVGQATVLDAFVADATGRPARLARRFGARRLRYDRLVGISALLQSPAPAQDTYTLVEAAPDGWWYSALLADGRLAVAFLGDGDLLDRPLLAGDPEAWWSRLRRTEATRERVEAHGYEGRDLRVLPAETSRLDRIEGDGWLAVGDAAVAYDPLSSYGVASAMGSGFYAGHAIADLLAGQDRERETARLAYLSVMQRACEACFAMQREVYGQERRWPDSPFWQRRQEAGYLVEAL
jgi:flavin-dependent dehydrogenase